MIGLFYTKFDNWNGLCQTNKATSCEKKDKKEIKTQREPRVTHMGHLWAATAVPRVVRITCHPQHKKKNKTSLNRVPSGKRAQEYGTVCQ